MTSLFASDVAASFGGGVSPDEVEEVLARARVRPSGTAPVPRRLKLLRIRFAGIKSSPPLPHDPTAATGPVQLELAEGGFESSSGTGMAAWPDETDGEHGRSHPGDPFDLVWDFDSGLYGIGSFENFRGKSSVLEVILWALRGRSHLQADVRAWMRTVQLDFTIDDERLTVAYEVRAGIPHGEVRSEAVTLAAFDGHEAFEASMDEVMMPRLGLTAIPAWNTAGSQTVTHNWVTYAGALLITQRSLDNLLGDTSFSGLPGRLLHMFVGTPWASTMVEAQVSAKAARAELEAVRRRARADADARAGDRAALEADLLRAREYLAGIPDTAGSLRELSAAVDAINARSAEVARLRRLFDEAQGARDAAADALRAEEARRLSLVEDALARRFFNSFEPTACPRCSSPVTEERRSREHDTRTCSVCATDLDLDALADDVILATDAPDAERALARAGASLAASDQADSDAEDPVDQLVALRKALNSAQHRSTLLWAQLGEAQGALREADGKVTAARSADALLATRRIAELDIARLEGALEQVARAEGRTDDSAEQLLARRERILGAAEKLARQRVQETQKQLLDRVSDEIVKLGRQFGIEALETVTLRGNATLTVAKGGQKVAYSACTRGERLRLKVATAVALLRVGFTYGVGRHPGLLMVDSPGAEEAASENIDAMLQALQEVTADVRNLQIIVATRSPESLTRLLSEDRRRIAPTGGYVW